MFVNNLKYRTIFYFTIFGSYWFLPLFSAFGVNGGQEIFLTSYYFFPGIVIPTLTLFLFQKFRERMALIYLSLNFFLYLTIIWMFSMEGSWSPLLYITPFFGALSFLLLTKMLVVKDLKYNAIVMFSLLTVPGFVVLGYYNEPFILSLSCFLWTFSVGQALANVRSQS